MSIFSKKHLIISVRPLFENIMPSCHDDITCHDNITAIIIVQSLISAEEAEQIIAILSKVAFSKSKLDRCTLVSVLQRKIL